MAKIRFSDEAKDVYAKLLAQSITSKQQRTITNSIKDKLNLIQNNPHYGNPIKKDRIPEYYKIQYLTNNLFRVELPNFWRMLYTLTDNDAEIEVIAFIIDICDHPEYNRKFKYRKN